MVRFLRVLVQKWAYGKRKLESKLYIHPHLKRRTKTHPINQRIRRDIVIAGQFRKRQTVATALGRVGLFLGTSHKEFLKRQCPCNKRQELPMGRLESVKVVQVKRLGRSEVDQEKESDNSKHQSRKRVNAQHDKHNGPKTTSPGEVGAVKTRECSCRVKVVIVAAAGFQRRQGRGRRSAKPSVRAVNLWLRRSSSCADGGYYSRQTG